ncbi:hypothetical protein RB213_005719, partial [Colletotrichum asianum]
MIRPLHSPSKRAALVRQLLTSARNVGLAAHGRNRGCFRHCALRHPHEPKLAHTWQTTRNLVVLIFAKSSAFVSPTSATPRTRGRLPRR